MNQAVHIQPENKQRNYVLVAYILFLATIIFPISGLAGVVLAYIKRDDLSRSDYVNHLNYLIRTFWIALIATLIGLTTFALVIGMAILFVTYIWLIIRLVVGFVRFTDERDIDPKTWWFK